jgi:hypothetical protein
MSVEAMDPGMPYQFFERLVPEQRQPEVAESATEGLLAECVEIDDTQIVAAQGEAARADETDKARQGVEAAFAAIAPATKELVVGENLGYPGDDTADKLAPAAVTATLTSPPTARTLGTPSRGLIDRVSRRVERALDEPKFGIRQSTREDVEAMVDIDMRAFSKVYAGYERTEDEQREHLREMFAGRFDMIGGKWMPVVTQKNEAGQEEVVGFMHCCPTSKDPSGFVSWEETTNNGRLDTLYDPEGKNVYVVSLSMDPKVKGQRGQNSLFMQQIGTFISEGMDTAFFESRMPGLRGWVERRCTREGRDFNALTDNDKMALAEEYFSSTRERRGKQVPLDPLLKVYAGAGCNLLQVLPDAYKDEPSMDFGVLCTFDNPMPEWAKKFAPVNKMVGGIMKLAAKSSWITRKAFG